MKRKYKVLLWMTIVIILVAVGCFYLKHKYDDNGSDYFPRSNVGEYDSYGPEYCPRCKKHNVGVFFYGLYRGIEEETPEMQEKIKAGKMIPGGCMVSDDSPRYHCNDCGLSWGRL